MYSADHNLILKRLEQKKMAPLSVEGFKELFVEEVGF